MKDRGFLSSPICPAILPTNPSRSTNRDDHLIPFVLQDNFIFKAQLTPLYMHPTDYTFQLYDKNQLFSHPMLQKHGLQTNIGLIME